MRVGGVHEFVFVPWDMYLEAKMTLDARLFIILFVRNFWRVCSQFWLSVRNSVGGPFNRNSRGNPSFCWLGVGGLRGAKNCEQQFCEQTGVS